MLSEEFVRRMAQIECSEWAHPIPLPELFPRGGFGYAPPGPILSTDQQNALERRKQDLAARCPFCIARAVLQKATV